MSGAYWTQRFLKVYSKMMRRSRRWDLSHPERKSQIWEIAVWRTKKVTRSSISFQGYRFDTASHAVRSSGTALESSGQTGSGGKVAAALPLLLKEPRCFTDLPAGKKTTENTQCYVVGTHCGRTKQDFRQCNKSKEVQNKKEAEDQLEPADQERGQRAFCSDDSAETEPEGPGGRPEGKEEDGGEDEEYYSNERIAEWVLKVNSSLFSTGSNDSSGSTSAETVKII